MSMSYDDLRAAEYNASLHKQPGAESFSNPHPRSKRTEHILTALSVVMWCVLIKLQRKLRVGTLHHRWSKLVESLV